MLISELSKIVFIPSIVNAGSNILMTECLDYGDYGMDFGGVSSTLEY